MVKDSTMHTARVLWTCKGAEDVLLISAGLRHVTPSPATLRLSPTDVMVTHTL